MCVTHKCRQERVKHMRDIRIERWAHTLVHYCLYLKPGDIVTIQSTPAAMPLIEAFYQETLRVGAHPVPLLQIDSLNEMLLREGNDAQLEWLSPAAQAWAEKANARLSIHSSENTRAASSIDPARA